MNTKLISIMTAFLMVAVAGILVIDNDSIDSDAAVDNNGQGHVNVYLYDNNTWAMQKVSGYDLFQAIQNTTWWTQHPATAVTDYTYQYEYEGKMYTDIKVDYGTISSFMNKTNSDGNKWNAMVFAEVPAIGCNVWQLGIDALGWYKPYTDYYDENRGYGCSNVALYYGSPGSFPTMKTSIENAIRTETVGHTTPLTAIDKQIGSAFEFKFYLKNSTTSTPVINPGTYVINEDYRSVLLTADMINQGVTVIGYGSDASRALRDAVGASNVIYHDPIENPPAPAFEGYGWMDSMFGLATGQISPYVYWVVFSEHTSIGDQTDKMSDLLIGAYSPVPSAPAQLDALALIYGKPPAE